MISDKIIVHNGKFIKENSLKISVSNRAFRFGDSVFETIFASKGNIHFFYEHIARIIAAMKALRMEVPAKFSVDTSGLHEEMSALLRKNKLFMGAKIRIMIYRKGSGLYTPETDEVEYLIETEALPYNEYVLNTKGLQIDIFDEIKKNINRFSKFKTGNSLLFVLAGRYKYEINTDDCVILNEKGYICEAISSNIFVFKDNIIYTPSVSSGCIDGIMRKAVIKSADKLKIALEEKNNLTIENIETADEIFLTNAVSGISWVGAFRKRRFFNNTSKLLIKELNKIQT